MASKNAFCKIGEVTHDYVLTKNNSKEKNDTNFSILNFPFRVTKLILLSLDLTNT